MIKVIGSQSEIKFNAARTGFRLTPFEKLIRVDAPTGEDAQTVGQESTLRAARLRAMVAQAKYPDQPTLGIESGIREVNGRWEEWAVIVWRSADGAQEVIAETAASAVPTEYVEEARTRGFKTTTVGAIIAERHGTAPDNPHPFLTHSMHTREELLANACLAIREALKQDLVKRGFNYALWVDGEVHALPIREIKEGVSIALFDPLGDWKTNERFGESLFKHLPFETEALIMPDGKAQALLHVLGRLSGLPTFVARKERKPYMKEPVVNIQVQSITTHRLQELYLDAEAAEFLCGKKVTILDDVVSTGETLEVMKRLLMLVGATYIATMAVFTEGKPRQDVIALAHLPLFLF